jgi:excisionase family DNA binding protein
MRYNVKNHRPIGVGNMQEQEPLTVEEVAKRLRVSAETVRMWIRTGELDAIDVGKYLIYPADLEAFKERRRTRRKRNPESKE